MNSTDPEEVSTPARLSGQVLPSASTLQAATAEVAPGLSRCNPDCILLSQTNSNSLCWHLQVGSQLSSSAAVTGKVYPAWYRVCSILLVCSCPLCFAKWREEDFNFFLQSSEINLFWGKYCQPTCCLLQPGAVQQQFICPWAVFLQCGHRPWQQMKPTRGMESCTPSFLLFFERSSRAPPAMPTQGCRRLGRDEHLAAPVGLFAGVIWCAVTALCWASKENKYFSEIAADPRDEIEKLIIVSGYERRMMVMQYLGSLLSKENRTFLAHQVTLYFRVTATKG